MLQHIGIGVYGPVSLCMIYTLVTIFSVARPRRGCFVNEVIFHGNPVPLKIGRAEELGHQSTC